MNNDTILLFGCKKKKEEKEREEIKFCEIKI